MTSSFSPLSRSRTNNFLASENTIDAITKSPEKNVIIKNIFSFFGKKIKTEPLLEVKLVEKTMIEDPLNLEN